MEKIYRIVQLSDSEFKIQRLSIEKENCGFMGLFTKNNTVWRKVDSYGNYYHSFLDTKPQSILCSLESAREKVIEFKTYPILHTAN